MSQLLAHKLQRAEKLSLNMEKTGGVNRGRRMVKFPTLASKLWALAIHNPAGRALYSAPVYFNKDTKGKIAPHI
jgi:hypothetical protein